MRRHRLAGPGFPDNADEFLATDVQAYILYGQRPVRAWRQRHSEISQGDQRHQRLRLGLRASFSPSPMKFSASTVIMMHAPGKTVVHQATHMAERESPIMLPQLSRLGSPRPRKAKADSVRMALPTIMELITTMGGSALGKIWVKMMAPSRMPSTRAAWTNSRALRLRNSPRTTRATCGQVTSAMPMTVEPRLGCRKATSTISSTKLGMIWKNSVTRISRSSPQPP